MEQVLFNLFDNGQNTHRKVPASRSRQGMSMIVILRVLDEGEGIPELIRAIFDKFFRFAVRPAACRHRVRPCNCRGFVEAMGGSIAAAIGRPTGAVFTSDFPCPSRRSSSRGHIMTPRAGPLRILVVDDDRQSFAFCMRAWRAGLYRRHRPMRTRSHMVRSTRPSRVLDLGCRHGWPRCLRQIRGGENCRSSSVKP